MSFAHASGYIWKEIYYEGWALETMRPSGLWSTLASWRPRKAGGAIPTASKGLRTRVAPHVNPAWGQEMRHPSSSGETGKKGGNSSFQGLLFYSGPQWTEGCPPASSKLPGRKPKHRIGSTEQKAGHKMEPGGGCLTTGEQARSW